MNQSVGEPQKHLLIQLPHRTVPACPLGNLVATQRSKGFQELGFQHHPQVLQYLRLIVRRGYLQPLQ